MPPARTTLIVGASPDLVEMARHLGRDGDKIGLLARTEANLKQYKERLISRGVAAEYFASDVTDTGTVQATFEKIASWSPQLDRLIYNVGTISSESASTLTSRGIHRAMNPNFFGFVNCFQFSLPLFRKAVSAHVLILSSARALDDEQPAAYAASKSALRIYVDALRRELSHEAVKFSEVYFGQKREAFGWRDLICEEIVDGVLEAIRSRPDRVIIGETADSSKDMG